MTVDVNGVMKDVEEIGEATRVAYVGGRTLCEGDGSGRSGCTDVEADEGSDDRYTGEASRGCRAGGGEDGEERAVTPRQC